MHKNGYDVYACPSCGLKNTKLTVAYEQFIHEFYTQGYFTGTASRGAYSNYALDKPFITRTQKKFLSKLISVHPPINGKTTPPRLLDIGCAYGYFVELALRAGYDAYGIDVSEYAVHRARQRFNGRIYQGSIGSSHLAKQSFDVITMLDVVEHLGDPRKDLSKVAGLLSDNGVFLMATGDTESAAARLLSRRWTFYIPPQHLFFYNKTNFTRLLNESGLEPILWFRVGKWLSLQYIFHLARTTGESSIAQWLYPLMEKLPLGRVPLYLPMRDNMVVIARKIR